MSKNNNNDVMIKKLVITMLDDDQGLSRKQYEALVAFCDKMNVDISEITNFVDAVDDTFYITFNSLI